MKLEVEIAGKTRTVSYQPGESTVLLDGKTIPVDARLLRPGVLSLIIAGRSWRIVLDDNANEPSLRIGNQRVDYRIDDPRSLKARRAHAAGADGPRAIKASMPGRVVRVLAQVGDTVPAQQGIVVIEAMKMQNELKSPKDGVVSELRVWPGDTVASGEILAVIE